jgi:hypothetical protein
VWAIELVLRRFAMSSVIYWDDELPDIRELFKISEDDVTRFSGCSLFAIVSGRVKF